MRMCLAYAVNLSLAVHRQRQLYCGPTAKTLILMHAGIQKPAQFWSAVMQTNFDTL